MTAAAPRRADIRLPGHRQMALSTARQRLAAGIILLLLFVGLLSVRLVELALFDGPVRARGAAVVNPHQRAEIVDRNGLVLASTFQAFALAARPADIVGDRQKLADRLAAILPERERAAILAALNHDGRFRFVARRISPDQAQAIRDLGEPGLTLEREPDRLYPNQELAAHLIGYTGIDGHGEGGIERAFDERLTDPARRNQPLVLSMDARIQQALESELAVQMEAQGASGAAGVVMDIHSGEVLAMTSLPSWNANRPGGLTGMPSHMNRATLGVYELGSTFKPFTVAMAMDEGVITSLAQTWPTTPIRVGRRTISDLGRRRTPMTVPEVLIHSSNVGTARMAELLGQPKQKEYLRKLGFLDRAPGEIPEAGRTLYPPDDKSWGLASVLTIGFGHGIAVSPLHLANAYATLLNGGIHRPATFLKVPEGVERPGERVFSAETSRLVAAMLRAAVVDGTGRRADAPGYRVGGKTGTAEKVLEAGRGYDRRRNITSFAGGFPMDNPRYVVVTMIDDPRGANRQAGFVAGPPFRNVVMRIAPVLGVAPDMQAEPDQSGMEGLWVVRKKPQ